MQRMKRNVLLAATVALLSLACASAPKIKVGWDQHADFKKYKTWAWKSDGSIKDPVWEKRFQDVLSDQLDKDGLKQVDVGANPDLWAVVHARLWLGRLGTELYRDLPDPRRNDSRRPRRRRPQRGRLAGEGQRLHRDQQDQRGAGREADRDHRRDVRRLSARDDSGELTAGPYPAARR
jgi:Spy/CpxP family protein refolding chaperone